MEDIFFNESNSVPGGPSEHDKSDKDEDREHLHYNDSFDRCLGRLGNIVDFTEVTMSFIRLITAYLTPILDKNDPVFESIHGMTRTIEIIQSESSSAYQYFPRSM